MYYFEIYPLVVAFIVAALVVNEAVAYNVPPNLVDIYTKYKVCMHYGMGSITRYLRCS